MADNPERRSQEFKRAFAALASRTPLDGIIATCTYDYQGRVVRVRDNKSNEPSPEQPPEKGKTS